MDTSKLKDVIQKLGFFKNYSSLLLPVVIMLVSVLLFVPTRLMSGKLKNQMAEQSISMAKKIRSLSRNTVVRNQWKVAQEYQKAFEEDANQTVLLARQSSQRQLLSYKIFPEPTDTSILIFKEFGEQFRRSIEGLISRMNASDCPTIVELERSLQDRDSVRTSIGGAGRFLDKSAISRLSEVDATIVDVLCREKAKFASVYANPVDFAGYEFWSDYKYEGMKKAISDCWLWQIGYWIMEDVADTIAACNSSSNTVFTSPVKRLIYAGSGVGGVKRAGITATPKYVSPTGGLLTPSCTKRFTNDNIDVLHFRVTVVVDAKKILCFMEELCSAKEHKFTGFFGNEPERIFKHNQITILESNIEVVNREDAVHNLYRYGEDAVVQLTLVCEYIFDKGGYDEIKPSFFKKEKVNEEE